MSEVQAWVDKLAAMGTPTRIAKFLASEGIQGIQRDARRCPLTNLLTAKIQDPGVACTVGSKLMEVQRGKEVEVVRLPTILRMFVQRFDNDGFPHLVDPQDDGNG